MRKAVLLSLFSVSLLCSCGGPGRAVPEWDAEPAWSEPVKGLALAVESGSPEYRAGAAVRLRVYLMNTMLKARYLDVRGNYAGLSLDIAGPDGKVTAGKGTGKAAERGDFMRLGPEASTQVNISGPANSNWSYDLSAPGEYTIRAVYTAQLSDAWNRQSIAGGKYEGQVLFSGRFSSPGITVKVVGAKKK